MNSSSGIDPEIQAARARQAAVCPPIDIMSLPTEHARRLANQAAMFFNDDLPEMRDVIDHEIEGPGSVLRLRLFEPQSRAGRGGIFYIHGGGWFHCNVETHGRIMRFLAASSGMTVCGIDYRLAPENPFPAPLEDCIAGWRWFVARAAQLDLDPRRLAIAGDSAGAHLALSLCIHERDAGLQLPAGASLFYGCFTPELKTESYHQKGGGAFGLTTLRMRWYWANYLGAVADSPPELAAPLRADLRNVPPIYLGVADLDPVADDSRQLASRILRAGGSVELDVWPNAVHGFLQMTRDVELARMALVKASQFLSRLELERADRAAPCGE
jgi:acetyl esterase